MPELSAKLAAGDRWQGQNGIDATPDLAIICGYGSLPLEIAQGAALAGRRPYMIGIENEADPVIKAFPGEAMAWGQIGKLFRTLKEFKIRQVVFAGGIRTRPDFLSIRLDWGAIRALPRALALMIGGDDSVLTGGIRFFEDHGIEIVGVHVIAPMLLTQAGSITKQKPGKADLANIVLGSRACLALGALDIGQAAIAEANRIVALEAAEGTDAMLDRVRGLRENGRMPPQGKQGVLVKMLKPGQDMRADLPAIGPATVTGCVAAGLTGIALEAGRSIILERERTLSLAREHGLYIYGFVARLDETDG